MEVKTYKFRETGTVVDAMFYDGTNDDDLKSFAKERLYVRKDGTKYIQNNEDELFCEEFSSHVTINGITVMEGDYPVWEITPGLYVVRIKKGGMPGYISAYSAEVFQKGYEEITASE